ncbi:ABC-2 type transport system permease protein [Sphingobacterium zeae]|uniref:ABC-2 type transport system permease protein n=2 Tax=Sphingobacterium zeae TaxID=1776859 RepID=A0ABU0U2A5_9SPHI|nr:ABC-2 type transport system permease protein [Sphingobacterium zeae]
MSPISLEQFNSMEKLILKFILLFPGFWKSLGINFEQFKIILQTKIILEDRKPISFRRRRKNKSSSSSSILQSVVYLMIGLVFMVILVSIPDRYLAVSSMLLTFISMLSITLVTDFSPLLLDTRDQYIILPRPVNDRTLSIARLTFIAIKLSNQIIALTAPVLVYVLLNWDITSVLVLCLQLMFSTLVALIGVNGFYLISIKYLPIQKFKDVITYIQIGLSLLLFLSYYVGPNLIQSIVESHLTMEQLRFLWIFPSTWIASFQPLIFGDQNLPVIMLSILGALTPLAGVYACIKLFSRGFNAKIAALASADSSHNENLPSKQNHKPKLPVYKWISAKVCSSAVEEAGFGIVWLISAKTREFKQQLYPSLAYLPIYFTFLFIRTGEELPMTDKILKIKDSGLYIIMFYLSLLTILTVFQLITQSNKYKAAWIYHTAPIHKPGQLMTGVLKACLIKYVLPFNVLFLCICIPLFGLNSFNDLLLSSAVGGIESILIMLFMVKNYPFSKANQSNSKAITNLFILGILGIVGFIHKTIFHFETLIWILAGLAWIIFFLMLKYLQKEDWKSLAYDDN